MEAIALRLMSISGKFLRRDTAERLTAILGMTCGIWFFWRYLTPAWALFPNNAPEPIPYFRTIFNSVALACVSYLGALAGVCLVVLSIQIGLKLEKCRDTRAKAQKKLDQTIESMGIDALAFFWVVGTASGRHLWLQGDLFGPNDGYQDIRGHIAILTTRDYLALEEKTDLIPNCKLLLVSRTLTEGQNLAYLIEFSGFSQKLEPVAAEYRVKLASLALNVSLPRREI